MDSPVSVAATELDSPCESDDAAGNAAGDDADGDIDDMYGFLARSVEEGEHDMLRARSKSRDRARSRSRERARLELAQERAPSSSSRAASSTTTAAATSSNRELRFRRNLDALCHSNNYNSPVPTTNPMILQMRAFVHTELPDYSRMTVLRNRWPSYPWAELLNKPWIAIKDSHKDCEWSAAFLTWRKFKIGITFCPMHRWITLDLGKDWEHMFAVPCEDEYESSALEEHYIAKYSKDHRLCCNTKGGEGKSPATPHFFYFAVRSHT